MNIFLTFGLTKNDKINLKEAIIKLMNKSIQRNNIIFWDEKADQSC